MDEWLAKSMEFMLVNPITMIPEMSDFSVLGEGPTQPKNDIISVMCQKKVKADLQGKKVPQS